MATILITGFGRFPGAPSNPSGDLARTLARIRRPALSGKNRVGHVFATSYAAVDRQLPALIARHRPDAIVMFGLATKTKHIRIELQARNRLLVLFPDATGFSPRTRTIRAQGPAIVRGRAPFSRLLAAARGHGMAVALSRNAGSYVCNYCYWRAIESTALLDRPPLIVFIHVPMLRNRSRPRANATSNAPRRVRLVETGAAILSAVAADLRASR